MKREVIYSSSAPEPIGPYSQAIRCGDMLFVSGQIGIDQSTGTISEGDVSAQAEQVMKNLHYILKEAGSDFKQVAKCTIFLKNMSDFPIVNSIYGRYFPDAPPARETVEVSRLPKDVLVEISCIALIH
jgi:2-iminobutanoate/2-iminopropanoate deaminase